MKKTALLTGASKRIGSHIAKHLSHQGYNIVVHYNNSKNDALDLRNVISEISECEIIQHDLRDIGGLQEFFNDCESIFGSIDLLINNAALFQEDTEHDVAQELFNDHILVNLRAPLILASCMARNSGPENSIINIIDNKVEALNPDFFSYTISKAALHAATQMLAVKYKGVPRINSISPSITLISGNQTHQNFKKSHTSNPLERGVTLDDIIAGVNFILGSKINGENLIIDSGQVLQNLENDIAKIIAKGDKDE